MRKTSYVVLPFITFTFFFISPYMQAYMSLANMQRDISSFGSVTYPAPSGQITVLRQSFQNSNWSAEKYTSIIDVYQGHYDASDKVPAIKAIRPDVLAFVYYNTFRVWGPGYPLEYDAEKLQMFKDNNWLLKDATGNYVTNTDGSGYYADIGNSDFHTWLANWYKGYIDKYGLDGASLDNWHVSTLAWYNAATTPINPRTGNVWTKQEICNGYKAMTLKIRQVIGSNKLILVNGIYNGNHFHSSGLNEYYIDAILNSGIDSIMSEGWVSTYDASSWYSEEMWKKSIDFAVWLEDNFPAKGGKYFMTISTDSSFVNGNAFPPDMTEAQYQQYLIYCYASRLLTVKQLIPIMSLGFYIENAYPQSLFKINIGTPSESYHTLGTSHVYSRTFSRGMVLVNPTSSSYTITISSGYKNAVTGSSISSTVTILPHTGLILTKV